MYFKGSVLYLASVVEITSNARPFKGGCSTARDKQALELASNSSACSDRASPDCSQALFEKSGMDFTNPSGRVRDIKKVAGQACCRIFIEYLLFPVPLTLNQI